MGEDKQEIVKKDGLFDIDGFATDALTPTKLKGLIAGIAVIVICSLLPLQEYGATCGLALGMLIATVIFTMSKAISIGPWSAIMVFIMVVTEIIDMNTVQAMIGTSTALMMIGLCIIGYGIEATPFGERISLLMLKKWGKKPRQIVFILFIASALLSSVLSNIAVCMLASNLGIQILERMGEEKKKSKFGKALMLSIMGGSAVGGIGFIQGSPGVNIYNQTLLQTSIGVAYDAKQWAILGFPLVILCLLPVPIVYMKFNKFSVNELKVPSESFYDEELAKLGPMGGSEIRWVLMTVGLIVSLLSGVNSNQLMILFVFIACAPVIGVIKVKDAFANVIIVISQQVPRYSTG